MDAAVTPKDQTMRAADSILRTSPALALAKGIAGFAILVLCFAGAIAGVLKIPFSPALQLAATVIGAVGGALLVRYTRHPSANK